MNKESEESTNTFLFFQLFNQLFILKSTMMQFSIRKIRRKELKIQWF